jgi:AcrR family transcriptional regulator
VRRRDAEASRRAILDAAEELFSNRGYDRASLAEIGRRAGVSAALPAYFFGGKAALYGAVLERLLSEREARLEPLASRAAEDLEHGGELRAALELLIDGYIDFLRERPALVRLMGREALDGGRRLAAGPRHSIAVAAGLARFAAVSASGA